MKYLLLLALLSASLSCPVASRAQAPATAPAHQVQYACLLAKQSGYGTAMSLQLDYGEGIGLPAPLAAQMKEEATYVRTLTAIPDALNYLGLKGWEYLGFNSILLHGDYQHRYMLRRLIK